MNEGKYHEIWLVITCLLSSIVISPHVISANEKRKTIKAKKERPWSFA